MPTLYLIRHAHKEKGDSFNPRLRHQDEPISPEGQEQARQLWSYLCDRNVSAVYISGYQRTKQTIDHVARQLGIYPVIDERLNEIDNGCFDGMSAEEIQNQYPDVWKALHEKSTDFRFPGGRPVRKHASGLQAFSKKNDRCTPTKTSSLSAMKD